MTTFSEVCAAAEMLKALCDEVDRECPLEEEPDYQQLLVQPWAKD